MMNQRAAKKSLSRSIDVELRVSLRTIWLGPGFTFDAALAKTGVPLWHVEQGRSVVMYVTNRECRPAGRLRGQLIVSMSPIPARQVDTAVRARGHMPVHGAPIHTATHTVLGITDLNRSDFGDPLAGTPGRATVLGLRGRYPGRADGLVPALRDHPRLGAHVHDRHAQHRLPGRRPDDPHHASAPGPPAHRGPQQRQRLTASPYYSNPHYR